MALPDVVIGGAPRSGTTFLCEMLDKHPQIYVARPFIPEPKICLTVDPAGDEGYRQRYAKLFAAAPAGTLRIEKTSNYFENAAARARLARLLPDTKFVFILRDPIERAYSNWVWSTSNGLETLPFAKALELEGARKSPLPPDREYARPFDYMVRGAYGSLAERWIEAIGRDRIGFYMFERLTADPERSVIEMQEFIGVEPLPWSALRTGQINANRAYDRRGLDEGLERELRERIEPEMLKFSALTGLDTSIWRRTAAARS